MKFTHFLPLACVLVVTSCAHNKTNTSSSFSTGTVSMETKPAVVAAPPVAAKPAAAIPASQPAIAGAHRVGETFPVSAGTISAPFVLTNGYIAQPEQLDIQTGGKAIYSFNVTEAGKYIVKGVVNAASDTENSFYVNIDAQPEEDMAIWGVELTTDFEERTVSWRGDDETVPKVFTLAPGGHKLIIIGREGNTQLKSLSIVPAPK